MITHFSRLEMNTVSVQGVKQFYHDQLCFPIVYESDHEIRFQPTEYFELSFQQAAQSLAPVHFAFEVPYSEFEHAVQWLQERGITLLKWPDGKTIDHFETGKNVYFRDGDGNLLEIIAHPYVKEGILPPSGKAKILYLREIGFPVDSVVHFRELLVQLFNFKLDKVYDNFTFAVGGTAHAVVVSKKRKWIPVAMTALPPTMNVSLGAAHSDYINKVKTNLDAKGILYESQENDRLYFTLEGYRFHLSVAHFPEDAPARLNLPLSEA